MAKPAGLVKLNWFRNCDLPEREVVNWAFLAMAIQNGVSCPIVDVAKVRPAILAADLLLGRDEYALRYIKAYRERRKTSR
jgi:5-methyltetrahydrofolate--homocysteine methyltransferase